MTIKSTEEILRNRYVWTYTKKSDTITRPKIKKNRFYIDNEFLEKGYVSRFKRFPILQVYSVLCKYANARTQKCWPGYSTLMKETGIKNRNTISAMLMLLEKLNIVRINRSKGRTSNQYWMIDCRYWEKPNSITTDTVRGWVNKKLARKSTVLNHQITVSPVIREIN